MAKYKYSSEVGEHTASAVGRQLPISFKQAIEICSAIRKKSVNDAKTLLNSVIERKTPVPYKRFNKDVGHKKVIGAGRYPNSASKEILGVIESAEANAQFKGLNTSNLMIIHISAQQGSRSLRYGRQRGRLEKRAHVELIVEEGKEKKKAEPEKEKKPKVKKEEKKVSPKTEVKKEAPKEEKKVKPKPEVKKEAQAPKLEPKPEVKKQAPPVKKVEPKPQVKKEAPQKEVTKSEVKTEAPKVKPQPKPKVETPKPENVEETPAEKKKKQKVPQ